MKLAARIVNSLRSPHGRSGRAPTPSAASAPSTAERLADAMRTEWLKPSFSQCGEDLIIQFYCRSSGIGVPGYIDVGAFKPWLMSNTALFYLLGARGMVIEPNPDLADIFRSERPRDTFVGAGVALERGNLSYYRMDSETLNTFSEEEARRLTQEEHHALRDRLEVEVDTLPALIERHWEGPAPDLLSIDIEGDTLPVLEALFATGIAPRVLCVETVIYTRTRPAEKDRALIEALSRSGYRLYADTWINTIFVRDVPS